MILLLTLPISSNGNFSFASTTNDAGSKFKIFSKSNILFFLIGNILNGKSNINIPIFKLNLIKAKNSIKIFS